MDIWDLRMWSLVELLMQGKAQKMEGAASASTATTTMDSKKNHKMKSSCHGNQVLENLGNLRKSDDLCDFTVAADGLSIKVQHNPDLEANFIES